MTKLNCILALIKIGATIYPLPKNADGSTKSLSISDPKKARRYFTAHPKSNYAVAGGENLCIVRVDSRDAMAQLNARAIANQVTLQTVKAGVKERYERHLYFRTAEPIAKRDTTILDGATLLGTGSVVMGPGSQANNETVAFLNGLSPDELKVQKLLTAFASGKQGLKRLSSASSKHSGEELLDVLYLAIRTHLVLTKEEGLAVALWIIHTHALSAFDISPRLSIKSPVKQCGKTTLLELLSYLVDRPVSTSNFTAASIFRQKEPVTILADEAETYLHKNEELRGILNSGHSRSGASALRVVDETTQRLSTFGAVAIASIGGLPDTLEDRSIQITLKRKLATEKVMPIQAAHLEDYHTLQDAIAFWAKDHIDQLKSAPPCLPDNLANREADNWRPLIAIADLCGKWASRARNTAISMATSARKSEKSDKIVLLVDIKCVVQEWKAEHISSADLVRELAKLEGRPWSEWRGGQPITQNALARMLADFEIAPTVFRDGAKVLRGYRIEQFADAFARYT